jgi:hypothetical protein
MPDVKNENGVTVYTIEDDVRIANDRHAPMSCPIDNAADPWKVTQGIET